MTAADLVAGLRRGGFEVQLFDGKVLINPGSWLSDADRAALAGHEPAILDVLRAEPVSQPVASCPLCGGTASTWEPGWHRDHHRRDDHDDVEHHGADHAVHDDHAAGQPEPVRGVWVCHTCITRPVPTLAAVAAGLTPAERTRFQAEANAGDRLAQLVQAVLCGPVTSTGREPSKQGDEERR